MLIVLKHLIKKVKTLSLSQRSKKKGVKSILKGVKRQPNRLSAAFQSPWIKMLITMKKSKSMIPKRLD